MSSKTRWLLFLITTPLVVFVSVGGMLGASSASRQRAFAHRAMMNGLAALGQWKSEMEKRAA